MSTITKRPAVAVDALKAIQRLRNEAEQQIERLIAMLDALDGDPDVEIDTDFELEDEHDESTNDEEPSLGSRNPTIYGDQGSWSAGNGSDLEDEHDGREPDDDDEDHEPSGIADMDALHEIRGARDPHVIFI